MDCAEGGKRTAGRASRKAGSFLNRERTIAAPSYSRWLIPAAFCVHLWIGQAYVFRVFNLPMTKLIGIAERYRRPSLYDQIRADSVVNATSAGSWTEFKKIAPMAAITTAAIQAMMKLRIPVHPPRINT